AQADAFRQNRDRELSLNRAVEVGLATEVIAVVGTVNRFERSDTVVLEAADDAVVAVEVVEDAQRLITPGGDVTATNRDQTDDIQIFRQRLVVVAAASDLH